MVLVSPVDRTDHRMDDTSGAEEAAEFSVGRIAFARGGVTHDLAGTLRRAFDCTADQLFDGPLRRDLAEGLGCPFDPSNVLNHEGFRHAGRSSTKAKKKGSVEKRTAKLAEVLNRVKDARARTEGKNWQSS
jgi:hypothetical protein